MFFKLINKRLLTYLFFLSVFFITGCIDSKSGDNKTKEPASTKSKSSELTIKAESDLGYRVSVSFPDGAFSLTEQNPGEIRIDIDDSSEYPLGFEIKPYNLVLNKPAQIKIIPESVDPKNDLNGIANTSTVNSPLFIKQYRSNTGDYIGSTYNLGKFSLLKFKKNQIELFDETNFKKSIRPSWKKTFLFVNSCIWTSQRNLDENTYSLLINLASEAAQGCAAYYLSNITSLDTAECSRLINILKITGEKQDSLIIQQLINVKNNLIAEG